MPVDLTLICVSLQGVWFNCCISVGLRHFNNHLANQELQATHGKHHGWEPASDGRSLSRSSAEAAAEEAGRMFGKAAWLRRSRLSSAMHCWRLTRFDEGVGASHPSSQRPETCFLFPGRLVKPILRTQNKYHFFLPAVDVSSFKMSFLFRYY